MPLTVRELDTRSESQLLSAKVRELVNPEADSARFAWLYLNSSEGLPRIWALEDGKEVVGVSAAFPRRMCDGDSERRGWVLGDFGIAPSHRALGPAVQLQRATIAGLNPDLIFDWPSQSMMGVYRRIGITNIRPCFRYVRMLHGERMVKTLPTVVRPIASGVATAVLRARDLTLWKTWAVSETPITSLGSLSVACTEREAIRVEHSAEFLQWRYAQHPSQKFTMLRARKNGTDGGYLVYSTEGDDARIAEFRATDSEALTALILECSEQLRERGCKALHASLLEHDARAAWLEGAGFYKREAQNVIVLNGREGQQWQLDEGDRES